MEILSFVLYFIVVLGIGIVFFFKSRGGDEKDYFLGGRNMGPWVTAMSAQASDMSAWLLMGLPGSILAFGLGQAWIGIGLAIGTALNWIFCAKRLRCFSKEANDSITLPQYLSNRFVTSGKTLQIASAVIFLVFFTVYVASSFVAGTTVFTTLFPNLNEGTAMLIFAAIIILYTFLGGYKAVCWTDFFQGLLMLVALLAVPIVAVSMGNLDQSLVSKTLLDADGNNCNFIANVFNAPATEIISGLGWGLGYFGMPHILVRFMGIQKPSMVKKSAIVAIVWVVLSIGATMVMAYIGRIFVTGEGVQLAEGLIANGNQKLVFIELARRLFPPFVAGLLLAAIIAASMSTADSQLLVASSSFTSDIYKPVIRKNASNKETLWIGRIVVLVIAVIAYFIASSKGSGAQAIMDMVENAWAGFGGSFGPVVLLSLFWKRLTYKGACAGVIVGAVVDVLWLFYLTGPTGIYEIIPAFICSTIVTVVVSLIDKKPSAEVEALFDNAVAECKAK